MSAKPPDRGEPKDGPDDRPGQQAPEWPAPRQPTIDLNVFATEPEGDGTEPSGGGFRRPTPRPLIVVAVLAALAVISFLLIAGSDSNGDTVAVPVTLVSTTTTVAATTTSVVTTTTAAVTTTVPPTTTSTTTTSVPNIEPAGSPVDIAELTLGVFGIGDLLLGDPAPVVLGRLASSLGQPDAGAGPSVSAGELGTCPGDQITVYRWGPLTVVTRATSDGGEIFYGYRLDGRNSDPQAPAAAMKTLSGLGLGDTVARARSIYSDLFAVEMIDHPVEGPAFEIREDGVLLWGPVTSTQNDGIIQGIFALDPCGGPLSG